VSLILRPRAVVEVTKEASLKARALGTNSRIDALTFLSDLSNLFGGPSPIPTRAKPRPSHVLHKITFYAAHITTCPTEALQALAEDLSYMETTESDEIQPLPENGITLPFTSSAGEVDIDIVSGLEPARQRGRPIIEELI
jgi:hypothetical protein